MHLMRKRAKLLGHVQHTNSQDNLPEIGEKIAYKQKLRSLSHSLLLCA
jgi:hypothetical protein